jgi:hypothetical protein
LSNHLNTLIFCSSTNNFSLNEDSQCVVVGWVTIFVMLVGAYPF